MSRFEKHTLIAVGITTILTLGGIAGCAGNAANTANPKAAEEVLVGTVKAAAKEDEAETYVNPTFHLEFASPKDFSAQKAEPENSYEEVVYLATNGVDSEVAFVLARNVMSVEGVTSTESWANAYASALRQSMEALGETNIEFSTSETTIGKDTKAELVHVESELNGAKKFRDVLFMVDEKGNGMRVRFTAPTQEVLNGLRDALSEYAK